MLLILIILCKRSESDAASVCLLILDILCNFIILSWSVCVKIAFTHCMSCLNVNSSHSQTHVFLLKEMHCSTKHSAIDNFFFSFFLQVEMNLTSKGEAVYWLLTWKQNKTNHVFIILQAKYGELMMQSNSTLFNVYMTDISFFSQIKDGKDCLKMRGLGPLRTRRWLKTSE